MPVILACLFCLVVLACAATTPAAALRTALALFLVACGIASAGIVVAHAAEFHARAAARLTDIERLSR